MATVKSQYQGKPVRDANNRLTDPVYYIVNPAGAVHECSREHVAVRLRQLGYRLATDAEIERYRETKIQRHDRPIATPYSPDPMIEAYIPDAEEATEELTATEYARDLAAAVKVDLEKVTGTGAGGQILLGDVRKYCEANKIALPESEEKPKGKKK